MTDAISASQAEKIGEKINIALQNGLSETDSSICKDCLREISLAEEFVRQLPDAIDELRMSVETLNKADYGHCASLIVTQSQIKLVKQEQAEKRWYDRYILPVTSGTTDMSAVDCSEWLDKTKDLPAFISREVVEEYKLAKKNVEQQLHKCRVQGVFVMYDKLSMEEKAEFRRLIEE